MRIRPAFIRNDLQFILLFTMTLMSCGGSSEPIDFAEGTWSLNTSSVGAFSNRQFNFNSEGVISYSEQFNSDEFEDTSWTSSLSDEDLARLNAAIVSLACFKAATRV